MEELRKKITTILEDAKDLDYAFDDEGEYPVMTFNEFQATAELMELFKAERAELLEALRSIEAHVQPCRDGADEVILNVARAAIAKATGEA